MRYLLLVPLLLLAACGTPSFLITPVNSVRGFEEVEVKPSSGWSAGKVVVIEVEGSIANKTSGGFLSADDNPLSKFVEQLEKAEKDSSVKAIVLRVNSPGGTVTASDQMYAALLSFKQRTKKPVVASIQDLGASGAYYVSLAADKIVAQPTSLVGSIGVIFYTVDLTGTMKMLGVGVDPIKSAAMKDIGSPFKPLPKEERAVMQAIVDEFYGRFVALVKQHRPGIAADNVALVTDGRVFTGVKAQALGLVDSLGSIDDAVAIARQLANAPDAAVVQYKRPYAFRGSIYADTQMPAPQQTLRLELPGADRILPAGFYYLWTPQIP